jgi:GxxExxY protein
MRTDAITKAFIDAALKIHTTVGPGMLESVYESLLEYELLKGGFFVQRQWPIPLIYEDVKLRDGFRADLLVERQILVEIKSVEALAPVHYKQVLSYLRCAELRVGLLINFNEDRLKNGLHRILNGYEDRVRDEYSRRQESADPE